MSRCRSSAVDQRLTRMSTVAFAPVAMLLMLTAHAVIRIGAPAGCAPPSVAIPASAAIAIPAAVCRLNIHIFRYQSGRTFSAKLCGFGTTALLQQLTPGRHLREDAVLPWAPDLHTALVPEGHPRRA